MEYPNPVGKQYLGPRLGLGVLVILVSLALIALLVWARLADLVVQPFAMLLLVAVALVGVLFVCVGTLSIRDDWRLAASMPITIEILPDRISGRYRIPGSDPAQWAERTLRFEKIDQLRPWRQWRPGALGLAIGEWGAPAAAFGKFESPQDGLKPGIRQTRRDRDIGAGEPYDVIYLTEGNFRILSDTLDHWKRREVRR